MGLHIGRYETLCEIASGGMATVHLARAVGVGGFERRVAIKIMHAHIANDPEFVNMFLDEARLAARIHHPNVVSTVDVQKDEQQRLFLVMDYVEGPSLSGLLSALRKANLGLSLDITLRIFLDALAGLHAAHELTGPEDEPLHLVHRDVSPQNILVGSDGVARITDFGVAHAEARLSSTQGGQVKGKLAYMSPEQILSEKIDRRCDIYAAGVVLWTLLTGEKYIQAENEGAIIHKILEGSKESVRKRNPEIPAPIDAVCTCALAVNPNERHATAAIFAEALEEAALASGIPVAKPRMVAALLKQLKPFLALPPVPGIGSASKSIRRPPSLPPPRRNAGLGGSSFPPATAIPLFSLEELVRAEAEKHTELLSLEQRGEEGNLSLSRHLPIGELSVGPSTVDAEALALMRPRWGRRLALPVSLTVMALIGTSLWTFRDHGGTTPEDATESAITVPLPNATGETSVAPFHEPVTEPWGSSSAIDASMPVPADSHPPDTTRMATTPVSSSRGAHSDVSSHSSPATATRPLPKPPKPATAPAPGTIPFQPSVL